MQMINEDLLSYVNELAPRQRQAVTLKLQGVHLKEIAFQMGIGVESAKTHVRLGFAHLRRWCPRYYVSGLGTRCVFKTE